MARVLVPRGLIALLATLLAVPLLSPAPADASASFAGGEEDAVAALVSPDGARLFVAGSDPAAAGEGVRDLVAHTLDTTTGAVIWSTRYAGPGDADDRFIAMRLSPDASRLFLTGTSVSQGSVVTLTTVALDGSTGKTLWVRTESASASSIDVSPDGSRVFVAGEGPLGRAVTFAYDAGTGLSLWMQAFPDPENALGGAVDLAASQDGRAVLVLAPVADLAVGEGATGDATILAYDAATGIPLWTVRHGGRDNADDVPFSVAADDARVYLLGASVYPPEVAAAPDVFVFAYDLVTGEPAWERPTRYVDAQPSGGTVELAPSALHVVFAWTSPDGYNSFEDVIARTDGSPLGGSIFFPDSPFQHALAPLGETLYSAASYPGRYEFATYQPSVGGSGMTWYTAVEHTPIPVAIATHPDGAIAYVVGVDLPQPGEPPALTVWAIDHAANGWIWMRTLVA